VPTDIVKKLHADLTSLLADPEVAKKFSSFGAVPATDSLEAFEKRIKSETAANKAIVVENHLQN
jgi:tripartite-type tricarboxylate transporter receptor subunit TctC